MQYSIYNLATKTYRGQHKVIFSVNGIQKLYISLYGNIPFGAVDQSGEGEGRGLHHPLPGVWHRHRGGQENRHHLTHRIPG